MMARILFVLALLPSLSRSQTLPTVSELLDRTRKTYAEARSYRDRGRVTVEYLASKKAQPPRRKQFSTAFARGGGLRFAYAEPDDNGQVLCGVAFASGAKALLYQSYRNAVDSSRALGQALKLLGAPTGSAARRVTALLVNDPKIAPNWLNDLRNAQVVDQETVGNRPAYHLSGLEGQSILESQINLWLDAETGLLLRFTERSKVAEYEALTTIEWEPALNTELPAGLLRFDYQNCLK
jgi:outer membrane lipoprotein-sorting protein